MHICAELKPKNKMKYRIEKTNKGEKRLYLIRTHIIQCYHAG
jgi:hypothetical protein